MWLEKKVDQSVYLLSFIFCVAIYYTQFKIPQQDVFNGDNETGIRSAKNSSVGGERSLQDLSVYTNIIRATRPIRAMKFLP
jgi:hypothetical protein